MPDEAPTPPAPAGTPNPTPPPAPPPAPAPSPTDWEAEANKWKELSRKHERGQLDALGLKDQGELQALRDKAAKFDDLEQQGKSDAEKAAAAAAAAEQRATEAEQKLLRFEVAAAKGIDIANADLLTGSTREEMEAVADRLAGLIKPGTPPPPPKPAGSADGGPQGAPANGVEQLTRADLKGMTPEQIVQARQEGRLADVMSGTST